MNLYDLVPRLNRYAHRMDYVLAVVCLAIGLYTSSLWWYAFAGISLVSALTRPTEHFQRWLIRRMTTSGH